jgi:hypothetical protein
VNEKLLDGGVLSAAMGKEIVPLTVRVGIALQLRGQ